MIWFGCEDSAFDNILEFANIAGPAVTTQRPERAFRKAWEGRPTDLLRQGKPKMVGEQGDVFDPRAQRWNGNDRNTETVEQVMSEPTRIGGARKIDVCRSDDAHIDANRCVAAHSFELTVFDGA